MAPLYCPKKHTRQRIPHQLTGPTQVQQTGKRPSTTGVARERGGEGVGKITGFASCGRLPEAILGVSREVSRREGISCVPLAGEEVAALKI